LLRLKALRAFLTLATLLLSPCPLPTKTLLGSWKLPFRFETETESFLGAEL
jgi:hypothetical protein